MTEKKIVFMNIVDGVRDDYLNLNNILKDVAKNTEYEFITAPRQVSSISLKDLKKMVEVFENVEHERNKTSAE